MDEFHSSTFIHIRCYSSISVESMDECLLSESALRKDNLESVQFLHTLFTLCHGFRVSEALLLQQCAHFPCSCRSRNLRKHPGWLAYAKRIFIGTRSSTATRFDALSDSFDLQTAISGKDFCFCFSRVFSGEMSWWSPRTELEMNSVYGSRRLLLVELYISAFCFEKFAVKFAVRMVPVLLLQQQQQQI